MRPLIGLVLIGGLALPAADLPPAYITAGAVRCGAVRRGVDQVQVWCWSGLSYSPATFRGNALYPVPLDGSVVYTLEFPNTPNPDVIEWKFARSASGMSYSGTGNGLPIKPGNL